MLINPWILNFTNSSWCFLVDSYEWGFLPKHPNRIFVEVGDVFVPGHGIPSQSHGQLQFFQFVVSFCESLMIQIAHVWSDFDMFVVEKMLCYIVMTSHYEKETCDMFALYHISIYNPYIHVRCCFPRKNIFLEGPSHLFWAACQVQCWRMLKGIIFGLPVPWEQQQRLLKTPCFGGYVRLGSVYFTHEK